MSPHPFVIQSMISFGPATRPDTFTFPSMANAGVIITSYSMILDMSVTLTISASIPSVANAVLAFASSFLHFAQPVPRIWIFNVVMPLSCLFNR